MRGVNKSLFESSESNNGMPDCPKCKAPLIFRNSKSGPFYGCSTYPDCDFSRPLHDGSVTTLKVIEDASCPQCAHPLAVKKGRYGLFIGCTNYPDCHFIGSLNESEDTKIHCPACDSGELIEKTNRYGKQFYSCSNYPECRYVVNSTPVNSKCPACGWAILVKKSGTLQCPQRNCEYKADESG